jgi:hypothetical protein
MWNEEACLVALAFPASHHAELTLATTFDQRLCTTEKGEENGLRISDFFG